jgi:sugar phosphate permease
LPPVIVSGLIAAQKHRWQGMLGNPAVISIVTGIFTLESL